MLSEIYIEITIETDDAEKGNIVMAQLNEAMNVAGVEELGHQLKFYFKEEDFDEHLFKKIIEINNINYSKTIINNKNWNKEWESNYEPVVVDDVIIRADFHTKDETKKYDILVTPKMSFGTGHHATTSMMVQAIGAFTPKGKTVIDFGTGTGILAILAHKMDAEQIIALDYDDWSIENAMENFEKNNCSSIQLLKLDHFPEGEYDVILANINLNVIADNMRAMAKSLKADGVLIISGILKADLPEILKISKECDLVVKRESEKNNWLCLAFKKEVSL